MDEDFDGDDDSDTCVDTQEEESEQTDVGTQREDQTDVDTPRDDETACESDDADDGSFEYRCRLRKGVELRPHQKGGIVWIEEREKEAPRVGILADEMGLGKSLQIIAVIASEVERLRTQGIALSSYG